MCIAIHSLYSVLVYSYTFTKWCSWLRRCATNRKVAGSIPDDAVGIFRGINPASGPGVGSGSNRNEYQGYLLGVKTAGA